MLLGFDDRQGLRPDSSRRIPITQPVVDVTKVIEYLRTRLLSRSFIGLLKQADRSGITFLIREPAQQILHPTVGIQNRGIVGGISPDTLDQSPQIGIHSILIE